MSGGGRQGQDRNHQYPSLSLEEVYGATAYYLGNRTEVDAYLERQEAEWGKWRAIIDARPCPVMDRWRAMKRKLDEERGRGL